MRKVKIHHFEIEKPNGGIFSSKEYQGSSMILLIFFKGVWCNFCKRQLLDFAKFHGKFSEKDIKIVAISPDSNINSSLLYSLCGERIPVLSDLDGVVAKKFNSWMGEMEDKDGMRIFVFSSEGKPIFRWEGSDEQDRVDPRKILKKVAPYEN